MSETQIQTQTRLPSWLEIAVNEVENEVRRVKEDAISKFKMVFDIDGDVTAIPTKNIPYVKISREFTVTVNNFKYNIVVTTGKGENWRQIQFNEYDWSDLSILLAKKITNILGGEIRTYIEDGTYILAVRKEVEKDTYYVIVATK